MALATNRMTILAEDVEQRIAVAALDVHQRVPTEVLVALNRTRSSASRPQILESVALGT